MIYIYNEDRLCEADSLRQALKLENEGSGDGARSYRRSEQGERQQPCSG